MLTYIAAMACVVGLAVGQIMFKYSAASWNETGSIFSPKTAASLVAAMALYAVITIAWGWVLQKLELGRAYPLMALAFVIVPICSHFVFKEHFTP